MPRTLTEGVGEQSDPRPVRRAGADPATTVVRSGQALAPDFTCPVCLRILRKTEIVVECLHRFCGECIQKCLRVAKHECPSCRIKVPSRRSLKRDAAFDALIATVYPDLDAYERGDEAETRQFNEKRRRQTGDRRAAAFARALRASAALLGMTLFFLEAVEARDGPRLLPAIRSSPARAPRGRSRDA